VNVMGNLVNNVINVATLGLIDDATGLKAANKATKEAGELQAAASEAAIVEQRRQFDIAQQNNQPFQQAGVTALGQQSTLLGLNGQEAQQQAFNQFNQSPGQRFLRERAERSLLRNSAAIGGLGGGNVRSGLQQQAIGFAQQDFDNQFNRLGQLSGRGQTAVSNINQLGANTAGAIGQFGQNAAQARASGLLGQVQNESALTGQLLGLAGQGLGAMAGAA